jgi:hypothetical protein
MQAITTVGLDIAKSVFQVHAIDAEGNVIVRRQLKRRGVLAFFQKLPPCLVGIEACASSHHWSRELQGLGHTVRLMPPAYVKPYVKRQKNDLADAEAGVNRNSFTASGADGDGRLSTALSTNPVATAERNMPPCAAPLRSSAGHAHQATPGLCYTVWGSARPCGNS